MYSFSPSICRVLIASRTILSKGVSSEAPSMLTPSNFILSKSKLIATSALIGFLLLFRSIASCMSSPSYKGACLLGLKDIWLILLLSKSMSDGLKLIMLTISVVLVWDKFLSASSEDSAFNISARVSFVSKLSICKFSS